MSRIPGLDWWPSWTATELAEQSRDECLFWLPPSRSICCRKAQLKMLSAAKDAVRARCCQTGQRRPKMKCRQGMSRSPIKATDEVLLLAKVPNDGELAQLETRVFWRRWASLDTWCHWCWRACPFSRIGKLCVLCLCLRSAHLRHGIQFFRSEYTVRTRIVVYNRPSSRSQPEGQHSQASRAAPIDKVHWCLGLYLT